MSENRGFNKLVTIVEKLRGEDGCPWDKEQTHASLLPFFLEEAYEVIETVDQEDWQTLAEELGDILLHVVFQANIAEQNGEFALEEVISTINEKLVRRHPHVFGEKKADGAFHAKQNWEAAKQAEKGRESRLDGVPKILPALIRLNACSRKRPTSASTGKKPIRSGRRSTRKWRNSNRPNRRESRDTWRKKWAISSLLWSTYAASSIFPPRTP